MSKQEYLSYKKKDSENDKQNVALVIDVVVSRKRIISCLRDDYICEGRLILFGLIEQLQNYQFHVSSFIIDEKRTHWFRREVDFVWNGITAYLKRDNKEQRSSRANRQV